jgi:hypothetical protein
MPRCASSSLAKLCIDNGIQCFGGLDMGFWGEDYPSKNKTSDYLYRCVSDYVGEKFYQNSFTFSSVRNPYSRAVSTYKHESWSSAKNFKDFCLAIKENQYPSPYAEWHSTSLSKHLFDEDAPKIDFVVKMENIQQDVDVLCDKIGIPKTIIPHENQSSHKHYIEYYDEETKEIISKKYAKDIEHFGYKFGE